jgi:predicted hotdog family 3-hydroxylacyl-ACP dehydratase
MIVLPADARPFLPHTSTARLLTRVVGCRSDAIEAWGAIPAAHPLAADGLAPAFVAIELGAQAAAAHEAMTRADASHGGAAPQEGRLVRIRDARLTRPHVAVEIPIRVVARLIGSAPPLAVYEIETSASDGRVADAIISTWSAPPVAAAGE